MVVGTARFVTAVLHQLPHRQLVSLQLVLIEHLKAAMTSDQKRHVIDLVQLVARLNKSTERGGGLNNITWSVLIGAAASCEHSIVRSRLSLGNGLTGGALADVE